ncbi:hypothetical protein D9M68_863830 [compost metagenome]
MADPCFSRLEQRLRQPAQRRELAHQQEQRNDREVVVREGAVGHLLELVEDGVGAAVDHPGTAQAAQQHRQPDGQADEDQQQKDRERPGREFDT